MSWFTAAALLFLVMDPIGNIPFFLSCLKGVDPKRRTRIIIREMCIGLVIIMLMLFSGQYLMRLFDLSEESLNIAGGVILFLIALKMIFSGGEGVFSARLEGEPFIVPLATPLVAGPSLMAIITVFMTKEPNRWMEWTFACLAAWLVSSVILISSGYLSRFLGPKFLAAVESLMGLLLTAVSVEMFIKGVKKAFIG